MYLLPLLPGSPSNPRGFPSLLATSWEMLPFPFVYFLIICELPLFIFFITLLFPLHVIFFLKKYSNNEPNEGLFFSTGTDPGYLKGVSMIFRSYLKTIKNIKNNVISPSLWTPMQFPKRQNFCQNLLTFPEILAKLKLVWL